jgi:hypothetical protein
VDLIGSTRLVRRATTVLPLLLSLAACNIAGPDSSPSLTGKWVGSTTVYRNLHGSSTFLPLNAKLTLTFAKHPTLDSRTQSVTVPGTWSMTFADPAYDRSGTFSALADRERDCEGGGSGASGVCWTDGWMTYVMPIELRSTVPCSSFYGSSSSGGFYLRDPNANTMSILVDNKNDPTCPASGHDHLSGAFNVKRQ